LGGRKRNRLGELFSLLVVAAALAPVASAAAGWQSNPPLPVPRTEVAAAVAGSEIAVVGGYLADGATTARVDLYDPARRSWRRGPDLPQPLNHAAAATLGGEVVVAGGYAARGRPTTVAVRLAGGSWRRLPPLPRPRAAAGAVALRGRLYVVGGVTAGGLARSMLAYDPSARRWRALPGPTQRQHLAAAVAGGRIYAVGGRRAGADTNVATVESWAPGERRWRSEPALPESRGGTGAAVLDGLLVSVGSEAPAGTSGAVYALELRSHTWRRLPDLPTPRHGLGVVAFDGSVFAIGGGPQPGLTVTGADESLTPS
jgi:non-specific serine/threonine protein kinase